MPWDWDLMEGHALIKVLSTKSRVLRVQLGAISAFAIVTMLLAVGLTANAISVLPPPCSGLDGSQGPLFFGPSSQSDSALNPTPANGSDVSPGQTVSAVYHDETKLLDANGDTTPGPAHNFIFKITKPDLTTVDVPPTFTALAAGTGFGTQLPAHDDAWVAPPGPYDNGNAHPDQEYNYVVKISGTVPSDFNVAGTYKIHLQANDNDNNGADKSDCGFADWNLHLVPNFTLTKTVTEGDGTTVPVGTVLHYTVTVNNASNFSGTAPTITDNISGTATHSVVSGPTASQGSVSGSDPSWSWSPGSLAANTSATLTLNVRITSTGTLINTAANGDDSHKVTNTGEKASPQIATTPSETTAVAGATLSDGATVSGGYNPTGTVTFKLYTTSDCSGSPVFTSADRPLTNGSASSASYDNAAAGTYHWVATYNGNANNNTATSGCQEEIQTLDKASPAISTTPSATTAVAGANLSDSATVSGGAGPTGTVTFQLFGTNDCSGQPLFLSADRPLSSGSASSTNYNNAAAGTYRWVATYNGDSNNNTATSGCQEEIQTLGKATPSIVTTTSATTAVAGANLSDGANVSGGYNPTGTVTFKLYATTDCSGSPVFTSADRPLSSGSASSTSYDNAAAGTYYWVAIYNGDLNNTTASSGCHEEIQTLSKSTPSVATVASGSGLVAGTSATVSDTATFAGGFNPTGSVTFTLFNSDCSLSTGVSGSGAIQLVSGVPTATFSATWTPTTAGTYNWVASYAGDDNNMAVLTGCHDANEQLTVVAAAAAGVQAATVIAAPALPKAGHVSGSGQGSANALAIGLLILLGMTAVGGTAVFLRARRETL